MSLVEITWGVLAILSPLIFVCIGPLAVAFCSSTRDAPFQEGDLSSIIVGTILLAVVQMCTSGWVVCNWHKTILKGWHFLQQSKE
ncbi:uncharacterized protein [Spinacia oleracea]|uniref:Uncharacterized protein isoform X2 n=1 Tax=Spinacia oleracea TaxID=3562 RepID=A0ABM3QS49_SPIOL|nr:uncharacterized protein LOC110778936 isoform X2 [Spinacia oleracea]